MKKFYESLSESQKKEFDRICKEADGDTLDCLYEAIEKILFLEIDELEGDEGSQYAEEVSAQILSHDMTLQEIQEDVRNLYTSWPKAQPMFSFIDLSGEAKMLAVAQWKKFTNTDGTLDSLPSEELVSGCALSDYHFTQQGFLYRDKNGNVC